MPSTFTQPEINLREVANDVCGLREEVAQNTQDISVKAEITDTILILPTADPVIAGALWNNAGVVNISAG